MLETFEANGVARTEINALLPEALQLSAYQWSHADKLKLALRQAHLDWLDQHFALEEGWLTGKSDSAHQHLFSYKAPELLHQWFQEQRTPQAGFEFKLHLVTPDTREIGPGSEGYYAWFWSNWMRISRRVGAFTTSLKVEILSTGRA